MYTAEFCGSERSPLLQKFLMLFNLFNKISYLQVFHFSAHSAGLVSV